MYLDSFLQTRNTRVFGCFFRDFFLFSVMLIIYLNEPMLIFGYHELLSENCAP